MVHHSGETANIAIIGGTGLFDTDLLINAKTVSMYTPHGKAGDILIGDYEGKRIAFMSRHGDNAVMPHQVNYKANIWALKELGVQVIIPTFAVGSLKEELHPGDFIFVDQFVDRTRRHSTFYDGKMCHISTAEPCCTRVRKLLIDVAKENEIRHQEAGTYVCIEGPRFSTKSESNIFRSWNADVVGMTLFPECALAREVEICYAPIAMITDYDCWKDKAVSAKAVTEVMKDNKKTAKVLLTKILSVLDPKEDCYCQHALNDAVS
jgi:5'-methylthioadenosine phosphorylase